MLTRAERFVAAAAGGVLVVGLVSTAYAGTPASVSTVADVVAATPTPTGEASIGPVAPSPTPTPKPSPKPKPSPGALPARAAAPAPPLSGCPAPVQHPSSWTPKPLGKPAVADNRLPKPRPTQPKAGDLSAITGKGIWVTNWAKDDVDIPGTIAKAKAAGLTSIWVRSGGSRQGYYGGRVLPKLVPAAHAAGLKVVAWDFPFLSDPVSDVVRAHQALATGIDAFAPDIETAAEGTHATSQRVTLYLSLVRSVAGNRPIAATVPRPTPKRLETFPYAAFAPYADVFVPMVYWSCNEPGLVTVKSIRTLRHWLPVAPVGQAYDMAEDGGRGGLPTRAETWRFLDSARRAGAIGASLWTIETIGTGQWSALRAYPWLGR